MENKKILVSACLLGMPCRYNGKAKLNEKLVALLKGNCAITLCPEMLSGMGIPRGPFEIKGGSGKDVIDGNAKIISKEGTDFTKEFIDGCDRALDIIRTDIEEDKISFAILCEKSPSCGVSRIYDGSFEGKKIKGEGIFTSMLQEKGIKCISSDDLDNFHNLK